MCYYRIRIINPEGKEFFSGISFYPGDYDYAKRLNLDEDDCPHQMRDGRCEWCGYKEE